MTIEKMIAALEQQQKITEGVIVALKEFGEKLRALDSEFKASSKAQQAGTQKTHRISPEGRKKIVDAQKRRWAAAKESKKAARPHPDISRDPAHVG